jgi:hypothetical protein
MSRGSHGIYAPLASTVSQGDDIALSSVATKREYLTPAKTTILSQTTLNEVPHDPHQHDSSRPRISSPLSTSTSSPNNGLNNDSEDGMNPENKSVPC